MAFQFASTNLVLELGILLAVLMGWQFTLAEFVGGPLMITIMVLIFKVFLTPKIVEAARQQADKGIQGRMEGHAGMDISIHEGTIWQRIASSKGRTAISHYFVMDWVSLWIDIGAGLLIAGALAAWVSKDFWHAFFLQGHPILAKIVEESIRWNYATILNMVFLALAAVLVIRFFRTGGPEMLRMMSSKGKEEHDHTAHLHGHAM